MHSLKREIFEQSKTVQVWWEDSSVMPGKNCGFPHCSVSGAKKFQGTSLFKLPSRSIDQKWKSDIVDVLLKYRELDRPLKTRISNGNIWICERHYQPSDIEFTS